MLGLGWPEIILLGVLGFFIFGPERLPTLARDAARMIRQLRVMADSASAELRAQLPSASEFGLDEVRSLRDLHPKAMIGKALFDDERGPDLFGTRAPAEPKAAASVTAGQGGGGLAAPVPMTKESYGRPAVRAAGTPPPYDLDAT